MRRRLKIPAAIVVTVLAACDDGEGPQCRLYCIPEAPGFTDAGIQIDASATPVECPECSDDQGNCPAGCEAVG